MKGHEIAKVVNELRDIAVQYRDAQQLRERIAHIVAPLLATHNAAAQEPVAIHDDWMLVKRERIEEIRQYART